MPFTRLIKLCTFVCMAQLMLITLEAYGGRNGSIEMSNDSAVESTSPSRGPSNAPLDTETIRECSRQFGISEEQCASGQVQLPEQGNSEEELPKTDPKLQEYVDKCIAESNWKKLIPECVAEYRQIASGSCPNPDEVRDTSSNQCVSKAMVCSSCHQFGTCAQYMCDSMTANNNTSPNSNSSTQELCQKAQMEIAYECNSEGKSWMQDLSTVTGTLNQIDASACSTLAAASSASQAALASFSMMCNSSYNTCKKACAGIPDTNCEEYGKRGKDAQARAMQAMQQVVGSVQQCQAAFGGETDPCANPANSGTIACKGIQPIGGGSPIAVTGSGLQNTTPTGMSHGGVGGAAGDIGGVQGYGLDDDGVVGSEYVAKPVQQGEEIGGAKGGGAAAAAASSGSAAAAGAANGTGTGESQGVASKILSGFFGSSGGGGGGSGGGRRSGGWKNFFGFGSNGKSGIKKGPDLRQFMPGGRLDPNRNRGVAGQYVGKDGISGPHANLWKLINNRYRYKRPTLLP